MIERQRERMIKPQKLLLSAAVWSYLAYSWPCLNYTCKVKYKRLENR